LNNVFIGVPCRLGCGGIEKIVELNLTDAELNELHISAENVRANTIRAQEILMAGV
jgi:malate dehydrogenase